MVFLCENAIFVHFVEKKAEKNRGPSKEVFAVYFGVASGFFLQKPSGRRWGAILGRLKVVLAEKNQNSGDTPPDEPETVTRPAGQTLTNRACFSDYGRKLTPSN